MKYKIINCFEEVQYIFKVSKTKKGNPKYTLSRPKNNPIWINPGEKIVSAVDTGNRFKLTSFLNAPNKLDYDEFVELRVFLAAIQKVDDDLWDFNLLKENKIQITL